MNRPRNILVTEEARMTLIQVHNDICYKRVLENLRCGRLRYLKDEYISVKPEFFKNTFGVHNYFGREVRMVYFTPQPTP
jgi:hypothetical protein